jgi:hypothetical protein
VAVAGGGFALVHARRSAQTAALAEAAELTEVAGLTETAGISEVAGVRESAGPDRPMGTAVLAEAPLAESGLESEAVAVTDASLVPVDKLSWRMPPLSELPTPVIKGARRIGLLGLRGYLAIAMIMVIVKIVETALGH